MLERIIFSSEKKPLTSSSNASPDIKSSKRMLKDNNGKNWRQLMTPNLNDITNDRPSQSPALQLYGTGNSNKEQILKTNTD